ncbi:MAG: phosphoadenosine phosphosulfate reductase family protein [Gemmatimonadetes bacterium]|nr:phosphoadenosine phosphosulfate reductase family protein [Gemmatimonadota bacterium]
MAGVSEGSIGHVKPQAPSKAEGHPNHTPRRRRALQRTGQQMQLEFAPLRPCYPAAAEAEPTHPPKAAPDVDALIEAGAIFYVSHSGGKDSQAMYAILRERIPHAQLVVIHADLGRVEWDGVQDHIRSNIDHPLNVVRANKTLLDMVRHRFATRPHVPSWPSSATRQCTSDLKRNPIQTFIRRATLAVNCVGLRAEESAPRARRSEWATNKTLSRAGRTVWDWNVVHALSTAEVFATIRAAGQSPFWAYQSGNERLSCVFCILGSRSDLANGRKHRPELYAEYIQIEEETGWTMFDGESLADRSRST